VTFLICRSKRIGSSYRSLKEAKMINETRSKAEKIKELEALINEIFVLKEKKTASRNIKVIEQEGVK